MFLGSYRIQLKLFSFTFENALDTIVGENGNKLSGGQ